MKKLILLSGIALTTIVKAETLKCRYYNTDLEINLKEQIITSEEIPTPEYHYSIKIPPISYSMYVDVGYTLTRCINDVCYTDKGSIPNSPSMGSFVQSSNYYKGYKKLNVGTYQSSFTIDMIGSRGECKLTAKSLITVI